MQDPCPPAALLLLLLQQSMTTCHTPLQAQALQQARPLKLSLWQQQQLLLALVSW
jgi:hypothetical protein